MTATLDVASDSSTGGVTDWLAWINRRTGELLAELRTHNPTELDALRGVYLDERAVEQIRQAPDPTVGSAPDVDTPFDAAARRLGLDAFDVALVMVAATPDLDQRYEQIFGYLNDDITRRRATLSLGFRLAGLDRLDPDARRRLAPGSPLVDHGIVRVDEPDRPALSRTLRVPDRVVAHLLGDDRPAPPLRRASGRVGTAPESSVARTLRRAIDTGVDLVYFRDAVEATALWIAETSLASAGPCLVAELPDDALAAAAVVEAACLDAALAGATLVVGPVDRLGPQTPASVARLVAHTRPVVITGRRAWDSGWTDRTPFTVDAPPLDDPTKAELWRSALGDVDSTVDDPAALCAALRLGPEHIRRAGEAARMAAVVRGTPVHGDDLLLGARSHYSSSLQRLTTRVEPVADWDALVLPPASTMALRELTSRVRHRRQVLDEWGLRRGGGRGDGVAVMFAGPSGTGKTLAAEVVARDLGLALHTVDVSTVVDKYIGETEKHLEQVFDEAERLNTVLFFDEADALFGKRSEVRDARDRYANVEVAYLLQRMERFDGVVVLATNLRLNIDDAFARRLDVVVDFPRPDRGRRERLWKVLIGPSLPVDDTVDLAFLAHRFEIAGGDIRNAVTTAAYLAADRGERVSMGDLVRGVGREYRKLGRLCLEHDFGEWTELVELDGDPPDVPTE